MLSRRKRRTGTGGRAILPVNQSLVAADVSRLRLIERLDIRADLRRLLQFMVLMRVWPWRVRLPMNPA
jgi:hypothetical protein